MEEEAEAIRSNQKATSTKLHQYPCKAHLRGARRGAKHRDERGDAVGLGDAHLRVGGDPMWRGSEGI